MLEKRIVRYHKKFRKGAISGGDYYEVIAYRPHLFHGKIWKWKKYKVLGTYKNWKFPNREYKNYPVVRRSPHLVALTDDERIMMDAAIDGEAGVLQAESASLFIAPD